MTRFDNGPAKGQTLMLKRAARFLRVTEEAGKFDALDQLCDEPRSTEKLYAYEITKFSGTCHVRMSGGRGGFYAMATYHFVEPQPTDAEMRTETAWDAWVRKKVGK